MSADALRRRRRVLRWILWPAVAGLSALVAVAVAVQLVPGALLATSDHRAVPTSRAPGQAAIASATRSTLATATPSPTPAPLPPLRFRPTTLTVQTEGFFSWALMDRRTGEIWGSSTIRQTTWPASMIKAWLASDDLRRLAESGRKPSTSRLQELEAMIKDSDNNAAQAAYLRNGGTASIHRLITKCHLSDTRASADGWSFTTISARDTVRMADCVADGTAAGPQWTKWVLKMMRTVRVGDWGIRAALPPEEAADVSIKNGWLRYDDDHKWHINCMAVTDTWAMAVLQRYPGHGMWDSDFAYGRRVCRDVAKQLLNPEYAPDG